MYKEYFNFSAAHFVVFASGKREPLHGHNYRVRVKADSLTLTHDMVFDFLDIKPLVRALCDGLDHKVLLPSRNPHLTLRESTDGKNIDILTPEEDIFSFPKKDVLLLPLENTTAEQFAIYLTGEIKQKVFEQYHFRFAKLEVEVEETCGQSAIFCSEDP